MRAAVTLLFLAPIASAQIVTNPSPPIIPSGLSVSANAGTSIAVYGNWMAVGAPAGFGSGGNGTVFLYERIAGSWVEHSSLTGNPTFGHAIVLSGSVLAISSPRDPAGASVRLYELQGSNWVLLDTLQVADSLPNEPFFDDYGWAMALDGQTLAVSEPDADLGSEPNVGAVHIYQDLAGTWLHVQTLREEAGGGYVHWGEELELSGDTLAVGAPGTTSQPGHADLYEFTAGSFVFDERVSASNPTPGHNFREPRDAARSIALDGDWLALGDPRVANNLGGVFLFQRSGSQWVQRQLLMPAIESEGTRGTGFDIDMDGSRLVAGCGFTSEVAYWVRGFGGWEERTRFRQAGADGSTSVGRVVRLDGVDVIAGYPYWPPTDITDRGAWAHFPGTSVLLHTTSCHGDGVEASCPCADSIVLGGPGCRGLHGNGGFLLAHGAGSFQDEDTYLTLFGARVNQPAIVAWTTSPQSPTPFGAGLLCLGGAISRLAVKQTDALGQATWGPGPAGFGGISLGDTVSFQAWYRDPSLLCGQHFNLSNVQTIFFVF